MREQGMGTKCAPLRVLAPERTEVRPYDLLEPHGRCDDQALAGKNGPVAELVVLVSLEPRVE
ncbi:MAG TPA: hypothetical protein VIJ76_03075 [Galbitalea sp.]